MKPEEKKPEAKEETIAATPIVGSIMWYFINRHEAPQAALIARVNEDGTYNACAHDQYGNPYPVVAVPIGKREDGSYLDWPQRK